jgi:hypothetical protein
MKIKLAGWIAISLLGIIVLSVIWYVFFIPESAPPSEVLRPNPTLPVGETVVPTTTGSSSTSSSQSGRMSILSQAGTPIVVNDFISNGTTLPDEANKGNYLLAGNLGYCISDPQQCQAASSTNFSVYYNAVPQSFTIGLTAEPIGEARLDMEQFMLKTLGISQQQMCNLRYLVGVTRYVNPQYTGKNLGFSFCPGATVLPE